MGFAPPPFLSFSFPGFGGGRGGSPPCCFVALWCSLSPVPVLCLLVSVPPSPFFWVASISFFFRWPATSPVGCVPACTGCPFLWWAAALGWVSPGLAGWSSGVLLGGPVGVAFGVALLGGLPASCGVGARPLGCVSVPCPLFYFFFGGRAFVVGRGFPAFCPVYLFLFFGGGGGFACSFLCLPCAAAPTGRLSLWLTGLLLVLRLAGPCPGPMGRVGYVHAWPGGLSCRVRFWPCRLGGCARQFREALGSGGRGFPCPSALVAPALTF